VRPASWARSEWLRSGTLVKVVHLRRCLALLIVVLVLEPACECHCDEEGGAAGASAPRAALDAEPQAGAMSSDPLLADARSQIRGGKLPGEIARTLMDSDDPAHQRARRLLEVMFGEADLDADAPEAEPAGVAPIVPPKIAEEGQGGAPPVPEAQPDGSTVEVTSKRNVKSSARASGGRASLSALSLQESARGATLTLHASGGVVVGVANQPRSGIVRLVVEASGAAAKVLSARPRAGGARVTGVRAGTNSVIVTIELDPGWSLGNIERTSSGARIHLHRPG
jgi:hypothetical protein